MAYSLWLQRSERPEAEPLAEKVKADICVVGGGLVGLWTAVTVKQRQPGADVILLEARRCGDGASGRNGGFVMTWWSKLTSLLKLMPAEEALGLARSAAAVPAEIERFCAEHRIDAGLQRRGWLWFASNRAQTGAWADLIERLEGFGEAPFESLTADEARLRTGSPTAQGGLYEPGCATVQPALLCAGLTRAAMSLGVRIHELSPVTAIEHDGTVRTANGSVRAERVAVALGAWTAGSIRGLTRSLIVVASDMVATAPAGAELDRIGIPSGVALSDSRLMVNYFHRTADDRLAFGTGGGALAFGRRVGRRFDGPSPRAAVVESNLRRLYPGLETGIASSWTGPVDRSLSGLPFVVSRGRVFAAAGFSGNGVGPSRSVAHVLAALALGVDDEWARSPLVVEPSRGFPPEPVRYLGGLVVRRAVARKERSEDEGRRPGLIARRLAGLAPAGLVPTEEKS